MTVTLSGKNVRSASSSEGRAYLYFPPRILVNKEDYFYSFLSTVAEIGGYVGLLMGISFLHLASTANRFLEGKIKAMEEQEDNSDYEDVEIKRFRKKMEKVNVGRKE